MGKSPSRSTVAPFGLCQSGFKIVLQMIVSNQLGCIITSQINILPGQWTLKLGIVHCIAGAFDSGIELQARLPAYVMSRVYSGGSLTQSHIPTLGIRVPPQGCGQVCCKQRHNAFSWTLQQLIIAYAFIRFVTIYTPQNSWVNRWWLWQSPTRWHIASKVTCDCRNNGACLASPPNWDSKPTALSSVRGHSRFSVQRLFPN